MGILEKHTAISEGYQRVCTELVLVNSISDKEYLSTNSPDFDRTVLYIAQLHQQHEQWYRGGICKTNEWWVITLTYILNTPVVLPFVFSFLNLNFLYVTWSTGMWKIASNRGQVTFQQCISFVTFNSVQNAKTIA